MERPDAEKKAFRRSVKVAVSFVAVLWLVKLLEAGLSIHFHRLGLYPRSVKGLWGILTAPLVHGDFFHLLSNTFPLLVLMAGLFFFYRKKAAAVFLCLYIFSQLLVWIFARQAYHIGASGMVYALFAFLFLGGLFRKNRESMALSGAIFLLYQGLLFGLFPSEPHISWESHLLGFITGGFFAFYFRKTEIDGIVRYEWDGEEEREKDI